MSDAEGDTVTYVLTLLKDGSLLMQHGWEMDGIPMVGYECFDRG